jgi:cyclopropane fatty-acyl-phospholipid synthase-like methyltransferase
MDTINALGMNPRAFYHLGYRFFRMPWEIGPRTELVTLVAENKLRPGRAVDLGCGTGANAVFLAQHGFEVTGIDFAPAGLAKARAAATRAGVSVRFVEADLTKLPADLGPFDVLVDYGTLDDLSPAKRDRYLANVVPLAAPGSRFLLWCFEWPPRRFDLNPMAPGEVAARFGDAFVVDRIAATQTPNRRRLIPGYAVYLMTRRPAE